MAIKIFNSEEIRFIQDHINDDPVELALKAKKYPGLPIKELSVQIASRQKAKKKLPQWVKNPKVIFPSKENLEQASSEITAQFKARWVGGETIVDLTGGTGVDLFYLSTNFKEIHYVESHSKLAEIARHNFEVFGKPILIYNTLAESFLKEKIQNFDIIYIDPSRRNTDKKRVFAIEEYQPNIVELYDQLIKKGKEIIVKVSPMIDIKQSLRLLPDTHRVQVVAVDNEVKEILFFIKPNYREEPVIEAWNLSERKTEQFFSFTFSEENQTTSKSSPSKRYIYEPNSAIRKAGAFSLIGNSYNLGKLHPNTHLYTSDLLDSNFPGRVFEVIELIKPNKKEIKKRFPNGKVNVLSKNYPLGTNELKKKMQLHDGGDKFLIFCETVTLGRIAICCRITSDEVV